MGVGEAEAEGVNCSVGGDSNMGAGGVPHDEVKAKFSPKMKLLCSNWEGNTVFLRLSERLAVSRFICSSESLECFAICPIRLSEIVELSVSFHLS